MIDLSLRTPLGIPVDDQDFDRAYLELERTGRVAELTTETVTGAIRSLARDAVLQQASGRWRPGRPDPADFVPGDAAAIRAIVSDGIVRDVATATILQRPAAPGPGVGWLLEQPVMASLLVDVATAVPYFIPTTAAAAVLASHPPHPHLRRDLRLPFERVLVLFGADLELDRSTFPWPPGFPMEEASTFGVVGALLDRGGYLSGMVLLAGSDGRLQDDVVWLVAANPDPTAPWPACLDRIRGAVRGWRRFADLAPLIDNVAAAIVWAPWRQPPSTPDIPPDLSDQQLRKTLKRNSARVRERQGALVGVHVLDLGRATSARAEPGAVDGRVPATGRASPIPHLRSGHFRRVRVGPRASFSYQVRWIPPVWVRGDRDRAAQRLVVRRLPSPATWIRTPTLEPSGPTAGGEHSLPADSTAGPPTRPPVPHQDPLGIDLQ